MRSGLRSRPDGRDTADGVTYARLVRVWVVVVVSGLLLAACTGGRSSHSQSTAGSASGSSVAGTHVSAGSGAAGASASASTPAALVACSSLIGKPVSASVSCADGTTTYDQPGSGECDGANGQTTENWYYFTLETTILYGKLGGEWQSAPTGTTETVMKSKIDC
jgi:hypothetical protein